MRREWAILCFLAGAACPLFAATPVTVAQLQQLLDAARSKSDGKVAKQLSQVELTERVSAAQFAQWQAEFSGGRTREALTELADASAFLDLPATEISSTPAPSFEEQQQIFSRAVDYAAKALSKLPNFYATRETTHFEDTPPRETFREVRTVGGSRAGSSMSVGNGAISVSDYQPLHRTSVYSEAVRYRDGLEVNGSRGHGGGSLEGTGLTTNGEFGPILVVVLRDSVKGKLEWGHWEQGGNGSVAVFAYAVPQAESHYMVSVPNVRSFDQVMPAYRGEIAIDPASGTILRVTLIAEMQPPYQAIRAAIEVEYAPVSIGDRSYVCPVKGIALSKMPVDASQRGPQALMQTRLNEIQFKDYHLFRGDTRILTGASPESPAAGSTAAIPGTPR